ncbi:MAG: hypothetical protein ACRDPK_03735 [Carbonactinosporaceae bacterium]
MTACFAVMAAFEAPMPVATVAFLTLAAALGAGAGAVFALLAAVAPQARVGAMTGIVGAVGGLGGFLPPLVMGAVYQVTGSYSIGLMLLSDVALAALVFTVAVVRATAAKADHNAKQDVEASPVISRSGRLTGGGRSIEAEQEAGDG